MKLEELVQNIMGNQNLKSELVKLKSFEEVYDFFKSNGYEGGEKELKENLFNKSAMSEEQLTNVSGGASGRQALAACAGIMMMLGIAPIGTSNTASAKVPFISNIIEKIKEKRHGAKLLKPTKKTPAEEKAAEEKAAEEKAAEEKAKNYDAEKAKNELEIFLKEGFKGSENAKDQIRRFFTIYSAEREATLTESELPSPRLLVFNGAPGGYVAENLGEILTGEKPYVIDAQTVIASAEDQYHTNYASAFQYNLADCLKKNKGKIKVVVFNGFDKVYRKDTNGKLPQCHPLDETLRDIIDGNLKDPRTGKSVDMSGLIVILTTNETEASLQGRIKIGNKGEPIEVQLDKDGDSIYDEAGQLVYGLPTKKGNQALVPHDGPLFKRMAGNIYYFDEN